MRGVIMIDRDELVKQKAQEVQEDLAAWAQQCNILCLGEQLIVTIAIVPVPDVVVSVSTRQTFAGTKFVTPSNDDWRFLEGLGAHLSIKARILKHRLCDNPAGVPASELEKVGVDRYVVTHFNQYLLKKKLPFSVEREVAGDAVVYKLYKIIA